jgi:hypothetical protein
MKNNISLPIPSSTSLMATIERKNNRYDFIFIGNDLLIVSQS